jgi:thiamine pyrophosphate-dependent acetolactate synthase large subunit-like protein/nitrite reductase/ring-hydroxylating ferredoxin subunit
VTENAHKILDHGELAEGRVTTVTIGHHTLAVTNHEGNYGCLDNHCPHQGGPLGEGSIENGKLRCPWHGYDYDPTTGTPPPPFDDAPACYPVEVRDDGIYAILPDEETPPRTVSDAMVETMTAWGVDAVFGIVGHSNLGFGDAIRKAEVRGDLSYYGVRHEGAAAFAASGYGKLTGRPAACFGIAGPGSTNLLTGLYDAKVDRAPVLALSGQVPSATMGRGAFQDLDLQAAFADVARYSQTVQGGSNHTELMNLACKTALVEADVAHLIFPDEVQVLPSEEPASGPDGRTGLRTIPPPAEALDAAMEKLTEAERPLIIVGAGARHDMDAIIALAEKLGAPVATTFKGKGQISDHHPLGCGVLGRSGTPIASWFMNESDLIVAFGASFANHTGISAYKPIVQVDFDPMALGRFHPVTVGVLGHVGVVAKAMTAALSDESERQTPDRAEEVAERWSIWRDEKASRLGDDHNNGLSSARIFDALASAVDPDAVIAVDVGNNTYSFGRYFEVDHHTVLMSGYLGSIGFGFPAAMGAWAANTGRQIVSVSGDGGFGQYAMELTTAAKYGMNITHVLVDNGELGKISKEQRSADLDVWQTSLNNPNFATFADNCGARGFRVERPDQLQAALAEALAYDGPSLVDIVADAALV